MTPAILEQIDVDAPASTLLAAARGGSQKAWTALVGRYTPLLWSTTRRFRLNEADSADVVQMTWLRLIESLDHIWSPDALPGWLVTTCRREALRTVQSNTRRAVREAEASRDALEHHPRSSPYLEPSEIMLRAETAAILRSAVEELPDRQRQLIDELLDVDATRRGEYSRVAAALDMPIGSIGPTRQRAIRQLRKTEAVQALR
jgi:RNA polymerase sigma factor (sigma-70 family)